MARSPYLGLLYFWSPPQSSPRSMTINWFVSDDYSPNGVDSHINLTLDFLSIHSSLFWTRHYVQARHQLQNTATGQFSSFSSFWQGSIRTIQTALTALTACLLESVSIKQLCFVGSPGPSAMSQPQQVNQLWISPLRKQNSDWEFLTIRPNFVPRPASVSHLGCSLVGNPCTGRLMVHHVIYKGSQKSGLRPPHTYWKPLTWRPSQSKCWAIGVL
jgi:hypothetical protein